VCREETARSTKPTHGNANADSEPDDAVMAGDYADQVAASIIAQSQAGHRALADAVDTGSQRFMPYNPTTGNKYRGMNAVWLMSRAERHGYVDARWMTYRQAESQKAHVRDGAKGTAILFWKWPGCRAGPRFGWQTAAGRRRRTGASDVRYEQPRVWPVVVFNAMQIDGLPPAPAPQCWLSGERHEGVGTILAHSGAPYVTCPVTALSIGVAEDAITLRGAGQFPSEDSYFARHCMCLGRWTGHPSRLNRDLTHPFGVGRRCARELRAGLPRSFSASSSGSATIQAITSPMSEAGLGCWNATRARCSVRQPTPSRSPVCIRAFEIEQELQN